MDKCIFCNLDYTKTENKKLEETKYFYITLALGSLVRGYVLIVSKNHINSMSELNKEEKKEYEFLLNKYRNIFKKVYKKYPIIFEHGTPNVNEEKTSSSVIHAHTHIVNHSFKNEEKIIKENNFDKINSIYEINSNKNYILFINELNELYLSTQFKNIKQLMRIEIAKDLNISYMYNWDKYHFKNNIILTIDDISKLI